MDHGDAPDNAYSQGGQELNSSVGDYCDDHQPTRSPMTMDHPLTPPPARSSASLRSPACTSHASISIYVRCVGKFQYNKL